MGLDAYIYVQAEPNWELRLPGLGDYDCSLIGCDGPGAIDRTDEMPAEATHEINPYSRHWSADYRRGHRGKLAGMLLELLTDPSVTKVWYAQDSEGVFWEANDDWLIEHFVRPGNTNQR